MASTGFILRISNLLGGILRHWVADTEKAHPAAAYESAIHAMVERYSNLRRATAAIIVRRDELARRLLGQRDELARTGMTLDMALVSAEDELALILIQKRNTLELELTELEAELTTAAGDADEAKAALLQAETEVKKLRTEKHTMLAKMASAEARLRIQEQLDGLSVEADIQALENVRSHVLNTIAEANLGRELGAASLEQRLSVLRARADDALARSQLDAMKAERGLSRPALAAR